jgi:two-component system sensor histidine kinase DctS
LNLEHRVAELQTLLKVLPVGIGMARDPDCRRIDVNPYFARLLDVPPGTNVSLTAPPGERPMQFSFWVDGRKLPEADLPLQAAARDGKVTHDLELQVRMGDGRVLDLLESAVPLLDESGRPRGAVGAYVDLTERRRAEDLARRQQEELAHLSRLVSIGEMAAGLAHELNQPLGAILNYAVACTGLLESQDAPAGGKVLDLLCAVEGETRRAGEIISRLRSFVRKRRPRRASVDLAVLIQEATKLMGPEIRLQSVRLSVDVEPPGGLPKVMADGVQVEQVLVNLIRNAVEAMGQTHLARRQLVIRAVQTAGSGAAGASVSGGPGMVRVSVLDRGVGIDAKDAEKIFDSFFTTKPNGLGVGLTISRSIVESHGGRLTCERLVGGGMAFHFTLPVAGPEHSAEPETPGGPAGADASGEHHEW